MSIDRRRLGHTVTRLRKQAGLTQQGLADRMGSIAPVSIAGIERGRRLPSLPVAVALADALGVTVDDLIKEAR